MYEVTTSEEKTGTSSQDLYTTESRFRSSTSLAAMNVVVVAKLFALHLLLFSAIVQTCY
jgi:hypothetical protein